MMFYFVATLPLVRTLKGNSVGAGSLVDIHCWGQCWLDCLLEFG